MATTYTAKAGDSLCSIAYEHGFGDCKALRAEPANSLIINRAVDPCQVKSGDIVTIPEKVEKEVDGATEKTHKFVKRGRLASIRFVHGSKDLPVASDSTLTNLNVSNFVTNRAGNEKTANSFPNENVRVFNAAADADPDTFKVEVLDIRASGNLKVELEALRPIYNAAGAVTEHKSFPSPRILKTEASKQGSTQRFRTAYLRLVVDKDEDNKKVEKQTLLTSDMFAEGDKKVEILDQLVKASYEIPSCSESPKCKAITHVPIGTDRKRIRLAIHILREKPKADGGTGFVSTDDAEKRLWTWFRRVYAQSSIAPKLMQVRLVDPPPNNLVAISDTVGTFALGTESLGFTINAPGHPSQTIGPITPAAGSTPEQTANLLAAQVAAPYKAVVSINAARLDSLSDDSKSCDIIITETGGARVTVDNPVTSALGQTLTIGSVNPLVVPRAGGVFSNVGTIEQRTLYKNYDTGDDRIDVYVCEMISPAGVRGTATLSGHTRNAARAAASKYRCSVLMAKRAIDSTENLPFTFPHEFGHVAGEIGHTTDDSAGDNLMRFQLMTGTGTSDTNDVLGSKRIRDGATPYVGEGDVNLIDRIRRESSNLLEDW